MVAVGTLGCVRRRDRATSAPAPASTAEVPPMAKPKRGPKCSDTQPTIGDPIGVLPKKTTEYKAMMRPRISGSDRSWSADCVVELKHELPAPTPTSISPAVAKVGATEAARIMTPKPMAASAGNRSDTSVRLAVNRAPASEPTLMKE